MRKFLLIATMILSCLGWSNHVSAQSAQQNTTRAGIEQLMQQLDQTIQANKGQTASSLLLNCGPTGERARLEDAAKAVSLENPAAVRRAQTAAVSVAPAHRALLDGPA